MKKGLIPTTILLVPPPPGFSDLPPALWSIGRCLEISNYKNSIVPRFPIAIWRVLDQEENTYRWEQQLITFILLKMPHPCVCFIFVVIYRGTLSWPIETVWILNLAKVTVWKITSWTYKIIHLEEKIKDLPRKYLLTWTRSGGLSWFHEKIDIGTFDFSFTAARVSKVAKYDKNQQ